MLAVRAMHNRVVNARFYAPGAEKAGDCVILANGEAKHLTRVLRLKAGSAVRVFNGRGQEFDARVESISRCDVWVIVGFPCNPAARESRVAVTLAQAVLKGDKMDDVVRDAVMMGISAFQPIVTARSEITLASLRRGKRLERWRRIAVSSAKQCGRATVPSIHEPRRFEALPGALADMTLPGPGLMFVEPSALTDVLALSELAGAPPRETTVIIGPEGGWSKNEIDRAFAVCRFVTLGNRTLRADAMSLIALAAMFAIWKEF